MRKSYRRCKIEDLKGATLVAVKQTDELIELVTECGKTYEMSHSQDCCEYVGVEEIVGDLNDLLFSPILEAEEASEDGETGSECSTWTFYKLGTIKGHVNIRWLGESNGYYSVDVDFLEVSMTDEPEKNVR